MMPRSLQTSGKREDSKLHPGSECRCAETRDELVNQFTHHSDSFLVWDQIGLCLFGEVVSYRHNVLVAGVGLGRGPRLSRATRSRG